MIQLNILSGKLAGASWVARHFPVRIGRAASADLRLDEAGVWDQHVVLELDRTEGFALKAQPNALARVNGQLATQASLRNGDTIELGAVRLQFWLSRVCQSSLGLQEALTWSAITAVSLGQIAILYWLLG